MKLTNPQVECLKLIAVHPRWGLPVNESYKPALKLVELGLARWEKRRFSTYLVISDTGKAELDRRNAA